MAWLGRLAIQASESSNFVPSILFNINLNRSDHETIKPFRCNQPCRTPSDGRAQRTVVGLRPALPSSAAIA